VSENFTQSVSEGYALRGGRLGRSDPGHWAREWREGTLDSADDDEELDWLKQFGIIYKYPYSRVKALMYTDHPHIFFVFNELDDEDT
jgi:hypothetical protein